MCGPNCGAWIAQLGQEPPKKAEYTSAAAPLCRDQKEIRQQEEIRAKARASGQPYPQRLPGESIPEGFVGRRLAPSLWLEFTGVEDAEGVDLVDERACGD